MTIIAYDGKMLAADRQATQSGFAMTVTKLRRTPDGMAASTGDSDVARALLAWAEGGRKPKDFPPEAKGNNAQLLVVTSDGKLLLYSGSVHAIELHDRFVAFGCGRDYALAAMHLGHDAEAAVQVACELDIYCGNGIDTMRLTPARKGAKRAAARPD